MDPISDIALMEKVQSGDVDKLGLLYQRYKNMLHAYFYRMTCCASTSEDLVQNVFHRILIYRNQFRNEGKFSSWMFTIAHNVFIDSVKKKNRLVYTDDFSRWEAQDESSVEDQIEQNEKQVQIKRAMEQLTPEQRETLVLSLYHDLKYREIAEILNVAEGTIKARVFRAMKSMKVIFAKMES